MPGQLFTQYFLSEGIRTTSEWEDLSPSTAELREQWFRMLIAYG